MMKLTYNTAALEQEIDAVVARTLRMDLTWDWPGGVAYYGIATAYEATGNKAYLEALKEKYDALITLGLPVWTVNTCAMGHGLITLYEATHEEAYKELIDSKIEYLTQKALRFGDGVLQHTVSAKDDFPQQAWADTLFMAAFFLLRAGVMKNDAALINDALHQYDWHIRYLQDASSGFWFHGYSNVAQNHMSGFYWGRANAWAAYTMSQVRNRLPECYLYPPYLNIAGSLTEQLCALKEVQTLGGLWRTILDDIESYEEVSASAGIAAAMLEHGNPLHTPYVQKALDGVRANIAQDGRVLNVSGGTAVMRAREGYRAITRDWIQGWGQGLALAFLCAALEKNSQNAQNAQ